MPPLERHTFFGRGAFQQCQREQLVEDIAWFPKFRTIFRFRSQSLKFVPLNLLVSIIRVKGFLDISYMIELNRNMQMIVILLISSRHGLLVFNSLTIYMKPTILEWSFGKSFPSGLDIHKNSLPCLLLLVP